MLIHVAFRVLLLNILIVSRATRFPLIHRDNYSFEARMKRDAMRVASLTRRLAANNPADQMTDLQYIPYSDYFAEVGVGTPPQTQTLVIDTGSDMLWVQCQSCVPTCYKQLDPVFDPKKSTSFADMSCSHYDCYLVANSNQGCKDTGLPCTYEYKYLDGNDVSGTMALENIKIGDTTVISNIPIGCTHKAQGQLTEHLIEGILGLGRGPLSFASQLGGMFSYCLGTGGGWLEFGRKNVPRDNITWARLINNQKNTGFYYIDLVGLSVGGEVLDISGDTFQLNQETGEGGVILDTGTVVTRLVENAYVALRDKFKEKMGNYPLVGGVSIFDTCYDMSGVNLDIVQMPTVSYNFSTINVTLDARNVLGQANFTTSTYCLAFAPSPSSFSIIGNMHQQDIQITIDAAGGYVGFGPGTC